MNMADERFYEVVSGGEHHVFEIGVITGHFRILQMRNEGGRCVLCHWAC
jgi:hypothetical protein